MRRKNAMVYWRLNCAHLDLVAKILALYDLMMGIYQCIFLLKGDSGGPLLYKNVQSNEWEQIGITSRGSWLCEYKGKVNFIFIMDWEWEMDRTNFIFSTLWIGK
jgi:hypothetical protein